MALITFSNTLRVKRLTWDRYDQDVTFRGVFGVQSVSSISPLWKVSLTFDLLNENQAGSYQALLMQLQGTRNRLALWNVGRPAPLGTFQGSVGSTGIVGTPAAGATSVTFQNTSYPSKTLKAGDFFQLGDGSGTFQLVMTTADATSDGSGSITVSFEPALRFAIPAGSGVVLQQPTCQFRQQVTTTGWSYERTTVDGVTLDLLEDWRA